MKIVIDISDERYKLYKFQSSQSIDSGVLFELKRMIANGIPLPKGHGDLVSKKDIVDIIKKMPNDNPSYWNSCDVVDRQDLLDDIDDAPTIIEAESEDKHISGKEKE